MRFLCVCLVVVFLCESISADHTDSEGFCAEVPGVKGHGFHLDRKENLWLWNQKTSEVWQLLGTLGHEAPIKIPEARAVAAEENWGVASLDTHGKILTIQSFGNSNTKAFALLNKATDLTWINSETIALSTPDPSHLIEVWDIEKGEMIRAIGKGQPTLPLVGATFLRSLVLEYEPRSQQIHTLESVTGELRIFDTQGKQIQKSQIPAHRLPGLQTWLRQVDQQAKAENRSVTPFFTVLRLVVASDGNGASTCLPASGHLNYPTAKYLA